MVSFAVVVAALLACNICKRMAELWQQFAKTAQVPASDKRVSAHADGAAAVAEAVVPWALFFARVG